MSDQPGCISGLLKLLLLGWLFDFLQDRFGFGRGCSLTGIGCGCVLLVVFIGLACSIALGTNWTNLGF